MKRVRTGVVGLAAGFTAAVCLAGTAMADTSVTSAIKAQDQAVRSSAVVNELRHFHATTPSQVRKLIQSLKIVAGKFDHAATVVSQATASTSAQKTGQHDWVTAVREEAKGFGQFNASLEDLLHHDKAAAKTKAAQAEKTLLASNTLRQKGDKLLGLPSHD